MLNSMVFLADGRCLGLAAVRAEDRFALILEPSGACFHLVPSFGLASRHITRFVLPKYKSAVKQLLDFRNAYAGDEVYLCDELYSEPAATHLKPIKHQGNPVLCPTSSRRNFAWVQRSSSNGSSGEYAPRSMETPQQIEFTCNDQFISKVQLLIHQYPEFSFEQFDAMVEETSRYIITRERSSLECLIKDDDSLLVLQNRDEFLTHKFADKPSKVYSAISVPHMVYNSEGEGDGYEIASIVKHMFQFGTLPTITNAAPNPPPYPHPSRLQVLCDVVDRNANTFTAFSDRSVLIRFHDRTLLKIVPGEDQIAHLLLASGETCLVTLTNPIGFEKYVIPCNEFLETCFLDPIDRLQRESEKMEMNLRIKTQLNKTKQLLRENQTMIDTLW